MKLFHFQNLTLLQDHFNTSLDLLLTSAKSISFWCLVLKGNNTIYGRFPSPPEIFHAPLLLSGIFFQETKKENENRKCPTNV